MPAPDRPFAPEVLIGPLRSLLRPLVRLLMRSGITFPVLADLLRGLYVDVALNEVLTNPSARTDSRVSLATGVHRKEIRRLRTSPPAAMEAPPVVTLASAIIASWLGADAYTDEQGAPLSLPRTGRAPGTASFESLVAAITTDVRPRAVLEDLLAQNLVVLEAGERVRLNVAAFVPPPGREAQLFYFGRNLGDHAAAASANIEAAGAAPFLDRSVHYDRLGPATIRRLEEAGREAAERLLMDFNRIALAAAEEDDRQAAATERPREGRINLGVYLYVEGASKDEPGKEEG